MIDWALLLHFYQPPTQIHSVLNRICDESYRPLIDVLRSNPNARVTINMNACLTELLADHGKDDIITGLAELAENGQIEFTNSGKYHPVLPLIPHDEMMKQIIDNNRVNEKLFGKSYRPRGFFPPEMCYGRNIVEPVLNTGHEWMILSGVACPAAWPLNNILYIGTSAGKLSLLFRDDVLSNRIAFHEIDAEGFIQHLVTFAGDRKNIYVVTALDAETFGHHIKNWEIDFLDTVYQQLRDNTLPVKTAKETVADPSAKSTPGSNHIKPVTISELLDHFKTSSGVLPKPSSWSTSVDDIKANNPYPLWNDPDNRIHKLLWEHLNLTLEIEEKADDVADNDTSRQFADIARELLDPALHSDQFWWASKRPHWDINMINRGIVLQQQCLFNACRAIQDAGSLSAADKRDYRYRCVAAENIAATLHALLFET